MSPLFRWIVPTLFICLLASQKTFAGELYKISVKKLSIEKTEKIISFKLKLKSAIFHMVPSMPSGWVAEMISGKVTNTVLFSGPVATPSDFNFFSNFVVIEKMENLPKRKSKISVELEVDLATSQNKTKKIVYRDKDLLLTVTEEIVPVPYLPKPKPGEIFQASELRVDVGYSLNQATYQGSDFSGFSGELSFGKIFTSNLASFFCVGGQNFQANTSYPVSKYICFLFGGKFNFLPDHPIDPYFVGGLGFDLDISSSKPPAPFAYQIGVGSEFEIVKRGLFIYTEMSAHVVDGNNLLFAPIRLGLDFKI